MTLLNFGKRYEGDLRVIFDQWQKLHLGLDALNNQKILKGIYSLYVVLYCSCELHTSCLYNGDDPYNKVLRWVLFLQKIAAGLGRLDMNFF